MLSFKASAHRQQILNNMHVQTDQDKAIKLFEQHFNNLVLFVNQYTHSIPTAEDIVQDMFVRLYEKGKLHGNSQAYLYVCARHDACNYLRNKHEYAELDEIQSQMTDEANIEDTLVYFERLQEIQQAVNMLPPRCHEVLRKIYYENKHYEEVAAEMGLSVNTVKTHVYLAIKTLKKNFTLYLLLLGA